MRQVEGQKHTYILVHVLVGVDSVLLQIDLTLFIVVRCFTVEILSYAGCLKLRKRLKHLDENVYSMPILNVTIDPPKKTEKYIADDEAMLFINSPIVDNDRDCERPTVCC